MENSGSFQSMFINVTFYVFMLSFFVINRCQERRMVVKHFHYLKARLEKLRGSEGDRLKKLMMMIDAAEKELNAKCSQVIIIVMYKHFNCNSNSTK